MEIKLIGGVRTAEFLLSEANSERSRALFEIPSGSGKLIAGTILKVDGSPVLREADVDAAAAVLYGEADATDAARKVTAVSRDAEVHGELLAWPSGFTDANKASVAIALSKRGIVLRWTKRPVGLTTDELLLGEPADEPAEGP